MGVVKVRDGSTVFHESSGQEKATKYGRPTWRRCISKSVNTIEYVIHNDLDGFKRLPRVYVQSGNKADVTPEISVA